MIPKLNLDILRGLVPLFLLSYFLPPHYVGIIIFI